MKIVRLIILIFFSLAIAFLCAYLIGFQKLETAIGPILKPQNKWTLLAVGDIQFSRQCALEIRKKGADELLKNISYLTNSTNLTVGNLESPFFEGTSDTRPESMIFGAETPAVIGLKNAGFDLVNLANNHFSNQGEQGMQYSFKLLNENNIKFFGAANNQIEAFKPTILTLNKTKIAFFGFTDTDVLPTGAQARVDRLGVAVMDIDLAKKAIEEAKKTADLVVVSMHSGHEYTPYANDRQKAFARACIDAGADLVLGHHPHVVQGIEEYKGKKIFYSLGNFIFDQPWSQETMEAMAVKFTFDHNELLNFEIIPLKIETWCQPKVLEIGDTYTEILNRIEQGSNF